MTTEDQTTEVPEQMFIGYGPAAEYLGLRRNTLSSYAARGIGPAVDHKEVVDQYNMPVFTQTELDRWRDSRPGQGARTDLLETSTSST